MAGFDGAGNWTRSYNWVNDATAGIKILASRQDTEWANVTSGFNNTLTRDGQGKPTADIDWNGKSLTNVNNFGGTTGTFGTIAGVPLLPGAAPVALVDAATITPDFATGFNFTVTLGGNRVLATPTNIQPGQSGVFAITQDATGTRTLTYSSAYKFPGGSPPLSTAAGATDAVAYLVINSSKILCNFLGNFV